MIAACPKCSARYRIDKGRLRPEGARLRCSRCEAVFRVRPPESEAVESAPEAPPQPAAPSRTAPRPAARSPEPSVAAPSAPPAVIGAPSPASEPAPTRDRERLVLVADPVIDEGKSTASALAAWGLQPILVHDGVEAILTIQRTLPRAAIIDAALPKMYGFQICELLKRNESLRDIHVVLVGAIHDRNRYRRSPTELYGADAYLERPQLPDALRPILHGFGLPMGTQAHAGAAPPVRSLGVAREPERAPTAPPPAAAPAAPLKGMDAEIAKAERLARIIVSDIILYNQEKYDAAVRAGDVLTAMDTELEEGRALFAQRIDARVRESKDYLAEELLRVAGMRRSP